MKIYFTIEEKNLLLTKVNLSARLRSMILNLNKGLSSEISEDDAADFWEACSDSLETIGFAGENDEPTAEGLILERLIDKFYC